MLTKTHNQADPLARKSAARGLTPGESLVVAGLILVPLLLMLWKGSTLPGAQSLVQYLSFAQLPPELRARTHHLLFAPVGALVVVFVRLTLGIRVLGPFRSVLLAIAFQVTGAAIGVAFFALVIGVVVVLRPRLKSMRLAYFGRSAATLVSVAVMIVIAMLIGLAIGVPQIERVAFFPVVVLTLTGDAFASTLRREGPRSAIWRASATVCVALLITAMASVQAIQDLLVRYPELVLTILAGVIGVCKFANLRLFQHLNPAPVKKKKAKRKPLAGPSPIPQAQPELAQPASAAPVAVP